MKVVVKCNDDNDFKKKIDVYAIYIDMETRVFSKLYCYGDMWNIPLNCELDISKCKIECLHGDFAVRFNRKDEAEAFVDWLNESEEKVQHGFRTMRD